MHIMIFPEKRYKYEIFPYWEAIWSKETNFESTYVEKENGVIKVITGIGRCCKFTNPQKISDTFASVKQIKISDKSVARYLDYFIDEFVLSKAHRYDIKGRRYIGSPLKYY